MADTGLTGAAGMRTMPQLPMTKPGGHIVPMRLRKAASSQGSSDSSAMTACVCSPSSGGGMS